jgi:hypothetical protein
VFASKVVVLLTYIYTQVQKNIHAEQKICFCPFICQTECNLAVAVTLANKLLENRVFSGLVPEFISLITS